MCPCCVLKLATSLARFMNSDEVIEVKEVYDRLIKAQVQWFDLGLSLGLDYNTLIQIDMEHCGESSACLYGMITERLKFDSPLTWKVLCDCLRKITVRRYDVALEIQQEIGKLLQAMIIVRFPTC